MSERPHIAILSPLQPFFFDRLRTQFEVIDLSGSEFDSAAPLEPIRAVVVAGTKGITAAQVAAMPKLELVCCTGAGFDGVDFAATRARGIVVTHGPGLNDSTVADHSFALMLAVARGVVFLDGVVRAGQWMAHRQDRPTLSGMRLGIVGLGNIGRKIALRGAAFEMSIAYHTRTPRPDTPWQHYASALELATNSDYLVLACPGGPETRHLVNAPILAALGPRGVVINIARGSVIDTDALVHALTHGFIAGAGLDVVDGEPAVPAALIACDNVVFTPHIAGRSPNAFRNLLEGLMANLEAHFGGRPVITPVPD